MGGLSTAYEPPIEIVARASASRWRPSVHIMPAVPSLIILVMVLAGVTAKFVSPFSPTDNSLRDSMMPPFFLTGGSASHLLGTDIFGRDQLSRIIYGAQVSLSVALFVLVLATSIGVILGLLAGFFGGIVDAVIMRIADITLAFPPVLIAIVLATVYGGSFTNVVLIITLFYWPITARQVRAEVLSLKFQDFVVLARTSGASNLRIIRRHILPSVVPTVLVITTLQIGAVIIFESALSFLGVGIPPPRPSWGSMIAEGRSQISTAWWLSVFPGVAIFLTVLSMNSLGDWLRDRLDPRLRQL